MLNKRIPTNEEILGLPDQNTRIQHLKQFGFQITDMSEGAEQYVRVINENNFHVINETVTRDWKKEYRHFSIDLNDYTQEDLKNYVTPYYSTLEEFYENVQNPTDRNMQIAEMIAEETCIEDPN